MDDRQLSHFEEGTRLAARVPSLPAADAIDVGMALMLGAHFRFLMSEMSEPEERAFRGRFESEVG